jgi:NADH-quinone oxidoreductase subunit A
MELISGFGIILLFIIGGLVFILITLVIGKFLRPSNPTEEKLTTYESGEVPTGMAWGHFNIRFYVIALIFLLFEAELVFLFPWATVFADEELIKSSNGRWSAFSLIEIFIFVGILSIGLAYVWSKGMLNWEKPSKKPTHFQSPVPKSHYEQFNTKY